MWTLPNILTLSRILGVPLLVAFLWWPGWELGYAFAFVLYALIALTDYLDGYLARAQGTVSKLGIFLDPIADKIMSTWRGASRTPTSPRPISRGSPTMAASLPRRWASSMPMRMSLIAPPSRSIPTA